MRGATGRKNGTTLAELDSLGHEILRYDSFFLWQAIDPPRRAAEQRGLLGGRRARCNKLERGPQHGISRRQLVDGEVAFKHAALGAERLDAGLDPRAPGIGDLA